MEGWSAECFGDLGTVGYRCNSIGNPARTFGCQDAIRRALTFQPDVALLGVVMPQMGGVEAAIKLLKICPGTKSVLVTESVPPETLEQLEA